LSYTLFWVFPWRQIKFEKPLKMDLTEGSKTSAKLNMTPSSKASSSL
jgi:hypothetical protein